VVMVLKMGDRSQHWQGQLELPESIVHSLNRLTLVGQPRMEMTIRFEGTQLAITAI
jgi:hypothetical protein